jgi:hypothetical protein
VGIFRDPFFIHMSRSSVFAAVGLLASVSKAFLTGRGGSLQQTIPPFLISSMDEGLRRERKKS